MSGRAHPGECPGNGGYWPGGVARSCPRRRVARKRLNVLPEMGNEIDVTLG